MEEYNSFLPRTEEDYLKMRVYDQICWYDKQSGNNKRRFLGLKITEICLSLCIPFLAAFISSDTSPLKVVVGVLGIVIAAIGGIITLIKFQENWIEYRTVAESLKLEKFLFLAKTGPYKDIADPFALFVDRFESLISTSTKKWVNYVAKKEMEKSAQQEDQ